MRRRNRRLRQERRSSPRSSVGLRPDFGWTSAATAEPSFNERASLSFKDALLFWQMSWEDLGVETLLAAPPRRVLPQPAAALDVWVARRFTSAIAACFQSRL